MQPTQVNRDSSKTRSAAKGLEPFREATRAPLQVPVRLKFDSFGPMQTGFSANVSRGGMFISDSEPQPVGTLLKFELQLSPSSPPVAGLGEVVWIRIKQTNLKNPRGMGIQFRYLDVQSLLVLDEAVHKAVVDLSPPEASSGSKPDASGRSNRLLEELEQALARS